jgi:hypothetical protein
MALHKNDKASPAGNYTVALAVLATVFFMWGFATVLNDILVPHLKAVFSLNYAQSLLVQFVFYLAYLLMAIPAATLQSYGVFLAALFALAPSIRHGHRGWRVVRAPGRHRRSHGSAAVGLDLSSRSGRAVAAAYRKHLPPCSSGFRESTEMSRLPAG